MEHQHEHQHHNEHQNHDTQHGGSHLMMLKAIVKSHYAKITVERFINQ